MNRNWLWIIVALIIAVRSGSGAYLGTYAQEPTDRPPQSQNYQFITEQQLSPGDLQSLTAARRAVWTAWFSGGDRRSEQATDIFERSIPHPLERHWASREAPWSLADGWVGEGHRLTELQFWRNRIHVYDSLAIVQGDYSLAYEVDGNRGTMSGRATEVFLKQDGIWLQTAWHWDTDD